MGFFIQVAAFPIGGDFTVYTADGAALEETEIVAAQGMSAPTPRRIRGGKPCKLRSNDAWGASRT